MKKKFDYILDLFLKSYNMGDLLPEISYGNQSRRCIHINQGKTGSFETKGRIDIQKENIIWKTWHGENIPFFFDSSDQELFVEQDGNWVIQFDLIASSFFLISGWQEYFSENHDQYGRFQFSESVQYRFGFTHLPVVNYYFDILRTVVEKVYKVRISPVLHDTQSPFTICLTHDIDTCESAWLEGSYFALKKRDLITPLKLVLKKLFIQDAWFNFSEILSIEETFNATSTFFFIPTNQKKGGIKNADYNLKNAKFQLVFGLIGKYGGEVGLHGSIGSSLNKNMLKNEVSSFPETINSNRFHFLLYDPKISLNVIEESGIRIDSSMGFAEQPGFRNSFCFPFQPFDIKADRAADLYEIPLTLMDGTLQKYLNLKPEESFSEIQKLIEQVKKFDGVLTVLWHNTHFSPFKYPGWKELYLRLLTYCQQEHALMQNCSQVLKRVINE